MQLRKYVVASAISAASLSVYTSPAHAWSGDDPFADSVVAYVAGTDGNPSYDDPETTIGPPDGRQATS